MKLVNKRSHNKIPCCVKNCHNSHRENPDLIFHEFPKNEIMRNEWIKKCFNSEEEFLLMHKNLWVCSTHFKEDDYFIVRSSAGEPHIFTKKNRKST